MGLIDTHTHLESFARKEVLPGILTRAREEGVDAMITIGTSPDDWDLYHTLAAANPNFIYYTVGLHPCAVEHDWAEALSGVERFWHGSAGQTAARPAQPVALGEIGLDRFHLPKDEAAAAQIFQWQCGAFEQGLRLARKLDCPVVIHSRGAFSECVRMIDESGVDWTKVVFHCFTEGENEMAELVRRGGFGSFTGVITYKSAANVRAAAKAQGLGRLMIETDAPYLTPMPHRGKPNEPAFVRHTAEFCASDVFGVTYEELAQVTTANARRFFRL